MRKALRIARQEILTAALRPSFLLGALIAPLFMSLLMIASTRMGGGSPAVLQTPEDSVKLLAEASQAAGFVDLSGIIQTYPPDFEAESLTRYPDEGAARADLRSGEIDSFYLIPEDYLESGRIAVVRDDISPWDAFSALEAPDLEYLLNYNLLEGDEILLSQIRRPMELQTVARNAASRPQPADREVGDAFRPMMVAMVLYSALMMGASLLVQSLRAERANRTLEVMLLSVSPLELVSGKIAGLGLVCVGQVGLWAVMMGGVQAFNHTAASGPLPAGGLDLSLTPVSVLAAGVFFLLGFLLYAALLTAAGVLLVDPQQITQMAFLITAPLMLSILLVVLFVTMPNGGAAEFFSLLPLTSPILLPVRLLVANVPAWQAILSAGLLALADLAAVLFVARLLRAHTLLTGQSFHPIRMLRTVLARA